VTVRLFVYGTLQPGASHWRLLEPLVTGAPRRARLPGSLYDTGFGYPALSLEDGPGVPGWVVELRSADGLAALDRYEGPEYERVRVSVDGQECWTYVWIAGFDGMCLLEGAWLWPKP
jgi:gamma-glutamylcyclotransferase (GGCT)/AIG2-like uncharacterized protein YtfP